jgi:hypothetical protein
MPRLQVWLHGIWPGPDFFKVTIRGKWIQFGPLVCVMIIDLWYGKTQITYDPSLYGQWVHPDTQRVWSITDYGYIINSYTTAGYLKEGPFYQTVAAGDACPAKQVVTKRSECISAATWLNIATDPIDETATNVPQGCSVGTTCGSPPWAPCLYLNGGDRGTTSSTAAPICKRAKTLIEHEARRDASDNPISESAKGDYELNSKYVGGSLKYASFVFSMGFIAVFIFLCWMGDTRRIISHGSSLDGSSADVAAEDSKKLGNSRASVAAAKEQRTKPCASAKE